MPKRPRWLMVVILIVVTATAVKMFIRNAGYLRDVAGTGVGPSTPYVPPAIETATVVLASVEPDASLTARPASGTGVGFRGDGTGLYPRATPPVEWSATRNVAWATELPATGNATPVLAGDRVFVTAEPSMLVCVSAADGSILWKKSADLEEALTDAERRKIEAARARNAALQKEIDAADYERRRATSALTRKPDDAELKQKASELSKWVGELRARLEPEVGSGKPPTHPTNGYASATPVCDGKRVAVVYGTGVAACYDLDGHRKWSRLLETPTDAWGCSASPVMVGDRLLVFIKGLYALHAETGEQLWRADAKAAYGTPLVARVGKADWLVTPAGQIVGLDDGKVLDARLTALEYNSPVLGPDDTVYFIQGRAMAFKLPADLAEGGKPTRVWEGKLPSDRYYASPVLQGGLIYAVTQAGHLSVLDARTGQLVAEKGLGLGGTAFPSPVFAGGRVYASSDTGATTVLGQGPDLKLVVKNTLEPFRGTPVFDGERMYVRGLTKLYCISEGRAKREGPMAGQ